jgi:CheY-like chemotaxis protein
MTQAIEPKPRRILLVDDDPLVLKIYSDNLSRRGFQVETAADGLAAMKAVRATKPDLMVLDLMMPRLSGVEVIKFLRALPDLADLPVVVLSNAYMDGLARDAATVGAQKALLKASCTPAVLASVITELLEGKETSQDPSQLLAVSDVQAASAPAPVPAQSPPAPVEPAPAMPQPAPAVAPLPKPAAQTAPTPEAATAASPDAKAKARADFLQQGPATCAELRTLFDAYARANVDVERQVRLQAFYRKVQFIASAASVAECPLLDRMAGVFEAFLFELAGKPARGSASALRTIASTVEFLAVLFERAGQAAPPALPPGCALIVDDDPLSNRLVVAALSHIHMQAQSFQDPLEALTWLCYNPCDLALLDIETPSMDNFKLCGHLRAIPGHEQTPVIYVTSHADFESQAEGKLTGVEDFIIKPVSPMELAVKAALLLLKTQLAPQ